MDNATAPALAVIARRAPGFRPEIAVILGSGWGNLVASVDEPIHIPYSDLQGFAPTTVVGHRGELVLGFVGGRPVAVLQGRSHPYEHGDVNAMQVPLQVLRALGCSVLVQTNAAGSLRADWRPESLVVLSDHINLPQRSPLVGGASGPEQFVSLLDAYDPGLRTTALAAASQEGVTMHEGIYAWSFGPQFETPAEIRMMAQWGADVVGMSTVPETILARYLGLRVLAISLITNMGAGLSRESLSHAHTLEQAAAMSERAARVLARSICQLSLPIEAL